MRKVLFVSSVCSLLALGCDATRPNLDAGTDGGSVGGDAGHDAATVDDGGHDAAASDSGDIDVGPDAGADGGSDAGSDAGVACSSATCSGTHACVRGTCILTCGADTTTFDTELAAGLVVIGSVCHTPVAVTVVGDHVYELATSTAGTTTTFTLTRWTRGSETPPVATVGTASFVGMTGDTTFPGGYVAVSPDETHALFGYTTSPASGHTAVGGIFDLTTGTMTVMNVDARDNYDATFLDATHYVVNGAPASGQGLYRATVGNALFTQVASHAGEYSGSVEVFGTNVLAGGARFGSTWADGMMGDRVLVFDLAAITSGTTPIDGAAVTQLTMPSSFELLSGGRAASLHYGTSPGPEAIEIRTLTRGTSGGITVASAPNLTTGTTFTSAVAAGADIVLSFGGGLLFVH